MHNGNFRVQLPPVRNIRIEECFVTRGDAHEKSWNLLRPEHGDEEPRQLAALSRFLVENVFGADLLLLLLLA